MTKNFQHHMMLNNLEPKYIFAEDDHSVQMDLCKAGEAIMFCPENQLIGRDLSCSPYSDEKLQVLTLDGYCDLMSIGLFTSAHRTLPTYIKDFYNILKNYYLEQIFLVRKKYGEPLDPHTEKLSSI